MNSQSKEALRRDNENAIACLVKMQVSVKTNVARKQADLPRFVVIPSSAIAAWKLERTTTIDMTINGTSVEPRTIKP